jgi:3'-5' exoribonuclease
MEYNVFVEDMTPGMDIEGFYVLKTASPKTTAAGKPYLAASISDKTGAIEAKVWDYTGPIGAGDAGKVIKIRGNVSEFKGALQVTIEKLRLSEPTDTYDVNALVPTAPVDPNEEYNFITDIVESIEDADYKAVCQEMLRRHGEAFKTIPAAKSVHHGFINGLLMHTSSMLRAADFLADLYYDTVDRGLLLAGTLLHDFAKEREFSFSELGLAVDYSVKGQLIGHLVMGAQEVCEIGKELNIPENKSVLLQHMVLSHHGEPEYGAAVRPVCAESELLSYIDMIDSRMEIYRETFEQTPVGEFSPRIFALDKKVYHHTELI